VNPAGNVSNLIPFKPGQSGNPGGRAVGARNRLTGAFLNDLADHYAEKGKAAIERLCEKDPVAYVRAIVALCPKQLEGVSPLDGLADNTLQNFLQMYQLYVESRREAPATASDGSDVSSLNGAGSAA
jgi:hypothetical protein